MVVLLLGGVGIIVGAIWLLSFLNEKASKELTALPESVVKRDQARREQIEKEKQEEQVEFMKNRDDLRKFLRSYLCGGDDKIAGELLGVIEKTDSEHDALCRDADMNNDPKDIRAFWKERLASHANTNIVLRNWLGGRSPSVIVTALFGEEQQRPRGNTPDFLQTGGYTGNGTGFCVSPDGWIVTNEHVAQDAGQIDVRGADGNILVAKVVKTDAKADLALLKIAEKPAAWLPMDPAALPMGGNVFTIGFPNAEVQGVEPKFTDGRISSLTGIRDDADAYQTSVSVGPGNSGGALVNLQNGAVAGVISSKLNSRLDAGNVSYAIKSKVLEEMLKSSGVKVEPAGNSASGEAMIIDRVKAATYLILTK